MSARVTWLGHATVLLELSGIRLLTDPVHRARVGHLVRDGPVPELPTGVDAVLLSHLHHDHADIPTLRRLGDAVTVIGPRGTASALRRAHLSDVEEVGVGDVVRIAPDVRVRAVPARHDGRRMLARHPTADALGFVVEGTARLYFAGDTDLFDDMACIGADGLDVALIPIWGWGTSIGPGHMDPERAAHAAALLRPRVAVPVHWGTFLPVGLRRRHGALLHAPADEFADRVAELAPSVRTRILRQGEVLEV